MKRLVGCAKIIVLGIGKANKKRLIKVLNFGYCINCDHVCKMEEMKHIGYYNDGKFYENQWKMYNFDGFCEVGRVAEKS